MTAFVKVQDDRDLAASGATVHTTWTLADGSTFAVEDATSSSGYAYFEILDARRGTYTLVIQEVILTEHRFDATNSVLRASITVK